MPINIRIAVVCSFDHPDIIQILPFAIWPYRPLSPYLTLKVVSRPTVNASRPLQVVMWRIILRGTDSNIINMTALYSVDVNFASWWNQRAADELRPIEWIQSNQMISVIEEKNMGKTTNWNRGFIDLTLDVDTWKQYVIDSISLCRLVPSEMSYGRLMLDERPDVTEGTTAQHAKKRCQYRPKPICKMGNTLSPFWSNEMSETASDSAYRMYSRLYQPVRQITTYTTASWDSQWQHHFDATF